MRLHKEEHDKIHEMKSCPTCQGLLPGGQHKWRLNAYYAFFVVSRDPVTCPKQLLECKKCHEKVIAKSFQEHIQNTCEMRRVSCPYAKVTGCKFRCAFKDMPTHAADASVHMTGLLQHVQFLEEERKHLMTEKCKDAVYLLKHEMALPINDAYNHNVYDFQNYEYFWDTSELGGLMCNVEMLIHHEPQTEQVGAYPCDSRTFAKAERARVLAFSTDLFRLMNQILSDSGERYTDHVSQTALKIPDFTS